MGKKKSKRGRKQDNEARDNGLSCFREKYALLGKAEWWWIFDDSLQAIGDCLKRDNFVVLDGFMGREKAVGLYGELLRAYRAGKLPETKHEMVGCPRLEPGALAGGRTGKGLTYKMEAVRGDFVAWFNGQEKACNWNALPTYLQRIDTLVAELSEHVPDLKGSASLRSNAMATCYPGNGAHYVRHCDNTSKVRNGRRLTSLYYVNPMWKQGDGGELRIFSPQNASEPEENRTFSQLVDVAPLSDRVVLFFADERVPHEVLPCFAHRFAVTTWFFDREEKEQANKLKEQGDSKERLQKEQERIKREIAKFQSVFGEKANIKDDDGVWELD